jgi:hypothetical protein
MFRPCLLTCILSAAAGCTPTDSPDDSATVGADTADTPAPLASGNFADTEVTDWLPVTSGNWPNTLTDDACDNASGPTCYDCLHVTTGTYARWYRVETAGGGYADDAWFEAVLSQLTFSDFDEDAGAALGEDGAYYAFDTVQACAAVYWLYP